MWTMTPNGFVSAVVHRDDSSLLMIRARDSESLTSLMTDLGRPESHVYSSFPSDYPYRAVVAKVEYADWLHAQVIATDYDNFKGAAARRRGGVFASFLHDVWTAGLRLTDKGARRANDEAWAGREQDWC